MENEGKLPSLVAPFFVAYLELDFSSALVRFMDTYAYFLMNTYKECDMTFLQEMMPFIIHNSTIRCRFQLFKFRHLLKCLLDDREDTLICQSLFWYHICWFPTKCFVLCLNKIWIGYTYVYSPTKPCNSAYTNSVQYVQTCYHSPAGLPDLASKCVSHYMTLHLK